MGERVETKIKDARETGKPVLLTPEQYAAIAELDLQYVKFLCAPTCELWRCPLKIDERDLERFSKTKVRIWYQPADYVTGKGRPRRWPRKPEEITPDRRMKNQGGIKRAADQAAPEFHGKEAA
jgi:hypothetical protein